MPTGELTGLLRTHLRELGYQGPDPVPLRLVRTGQPGDVQTAVARSIAGRGAVHLADALAVRLRREDAFAQVQAEAGHLRLTLTTAALAGGVRRLLSAGPAAGPEPRTPGGWPAHLGPVAYAHARCRNVARAAHAHGVRPTPGAELDRALSAVVDREHSRALLVRLTLDLPGGRGADVALRDLATAYQDFYTRTRTAPRGAEPVTSEHRTHLALTEASAVALATGLASLGLHAPEHL